MTPNLKPIKDPEDKRGEPIVMPPTMKMRAIETCQLSSDGKPLPVKSLNNVVKEDKVKGLSRVGGKDSIIECLKISADVLDNIKLVDGHKGVIIGKGDNKRYCGNIIQKVPMGAYTRIGSGQSVFSDTPPIEKGEKLVFKFDRRKQLALKVGNNVGKDWVVVVAANGCIFLDTSSYASFHMPMFVVEQTGDYYRVDKGNRILLLGPGRHLVFYTKEAPILYVRNHTVTHQQTIPLTEIAATSHKSESLKSKEISEEDKQKKEVLKNKSEPKKEKSKEESIKEKPKEEPIKEKSKEEPKKEVPKIIVEEVVKPKPKEKTESMAPIIPSAPKESPKESSKETPKPVIVLKEIRGLSENTSPKPKSEKKLTPKLRQGSLRMPSEEYAE